jgi:hypothetical protein
VNVFVLVWKCSTTPDVERMIVAGRLYVGIVGSHSNKTLFKRVRRLRPPKDAKAASTSKMRWDTTRTQLMITRGRRGDRHVGDVRSIERLHSSQ